jgi:hypothetical protein
VQKLAPVWTDDLHALWSRIEGHDFGCGRARDFTYRLARHTGWGISAARRAILEYRRFCFVACVTKDPVTPSEEIDEVWHLHLIDSADYWNVWCRNVLGRPFHHHPSRGDALEDNGFRVHYATTLARYERYFGSPAEAFWPATHRRFGKNPRVRMVDRAKWFLLPRPGVLWRHHRNIEV